MLLFLRMLELTIHNSFMMEALFLMRSLRPSGMDASPPTA